MAKARQIVRALDQLDADKAAAARQCHVIEARPIIVRQMELAFRRVGIGLVVNVTRTDRKRETRAKPMGRSHQVSKIARFRYAFRADGEIATRLRRPTVFAVVFGDMCLGHGRLLVPAGVLLARLAA